MEPIGRRETITDRVDRELGGGQGAPVLETGHECIGFGFDGGVEKRSLHGGTNGSFHVCSLIAVARALPLVKDKK